MPIDPTHGAHTPPGSARALAETSALSLRRLLPPGEPTTVEGFVEGLDLAERAAGGPSSRPYALLNMVSTVDGRVTVKGRSGAIGGQADKALFLALRTAVDGVMAGAGTMRAEHYRRLVRDEHRRAIRRARGLAEEPLACIVSGRLALGAEIPLLADPEARVAILTTSQASLPRDCRAGIQYIRAVRDGLLDLTGAMAQLREDHGVHTLLCEGGPHLNAQLLAERLVDELFLSLGPVLAGGDATSETLRIISGPELDPPHALELMSALEHDSHLFLRYKILH
ncbi:MAG TPA: dihydrofolate reductase family protein [Solirubrobacteraceae bacterium]|jgi:riboflavin biosynthesis pyrimidine reductase|nr:dihydrofolate reductase family protein [Solirubrobacteraceae bacterium]